MEFERKIFRKIDIVNGPANIEDKEERWSVADVL